MSDEAEPKGTTYFHQQALTDPAPGGRFGAAPRPRVNGSEPTVTPPAVPEWCEDPCGVEPPLGYSIDELPE